MTVTTIYTTTLHVIIPVLARPRRNTVGGQQFIRGHAEKTMTVNLWALIYIKVNMLTMVMSSTKATTAIILITRRNTTAIGSGIMTTIMTSAATIRSQATAGSLI